MAVFSCVSLKRMDCIHRILCNRYLMSSNWYCCDWIYIILERRESSKCLQENGNTAITIRKLVTIAVLGGPWWYKMYVLKVLVLIKHVVIVLDGIPTVLWLLTNKYNIILHLRKKLLKNIERINTISTVRDC